MKIEFRDARIEDAPLIAWTVMKAVDMEWDDMSMAEATCEREDTLYSWKRSRIAEVDGVAAGCLISYPGDDYPPLRARTWKSMWDFPDGALDGIEQETFPGEYYLDSLAVKPEFRGLGLGKMLLLDGVRKGQALGFQTPTLIVEADSPALISYYESAGFSRYGEMTFFGHKYLRMRYL